ncbi:transglycosylase, partial [Xanthomonas vasicola pv. vasculorum]
RAGRSTDIGLMQINSQHLGKFGLTPIDLLDPCTNIRVGTTILSQNYAQTWAKYRAEKPALLGALSMYNTGNESR